MINMLKLLEGRQPLKARRRWLKDGLFIVLLMVATVAVYWPAMHGRFVWDDNEHIYDNQTLRSLHGLWEIWFKPGATCQYYPLSFTGFWIGFQLWGLNPLGYHLLNVVLHSLVAVLLWQVLTRLKARGAWLAGAVFALHPVCVMSVAWMTELKNTLSASLALGAAWAYLRFAHLGVYEAGTDAGEVSPLRPSPPAGDRNSRTDWWFYALSLGLFQLGLFAKTAISFLPVSLLLVTWWRRERLRWRDLWPLIPMLGLAVAMGQLTFYIEHLHGAAGEEFKMDFLERVLISGRSFWFYLGKLFFPHQLTFIYERWHMDAHAPWQYLYPITTAALLAGLWWGRRRIGKGLFVALLHFYVCTSLLILMVVLYMTRYSFVSDHWQYFGCMSVVALAAAGITAALGRFENERPFLKPALCGMLLLTLGVLTWRQAGTFADAETLWRTTIARNPDAWMAHNDFGYDLLRWGRVDEAIAQFQKTLEIKPDHASAHYYLGRALLQKGRVDEAIAQFQMVLALQPDDAPARNNLGQILLQKGQEREALVQFQKVLENDPGDPMANFNLGTFLLAKGRVDEAIARFQKSLAVQPGSLLARNNLGTALLLKGQEREALVQFQMALEYDPGDPTAHYNIGLMLCQQGRLDEGIEQFQKALETRPDFAEAHNNLGNALLQKGLVDEAIAHFQKALEIRPDFADVRDNLDNAAWLLATSPEASLRNGPKALALARQLDRVSGGNNPVILDTLAAAYAETGQFSEAVDAAQRALALARAQNNTVLAEALRQQVKLLQAGSPLRSTPPKEPAPGPNQP